MKIETIDIQNNSDGQAIQIPEDFRIDDDKVYLKKKRKHNLYHSISQTMAKSFRESRRVYSWFYG